MYKRQVVEFTKTSLTDGKEVEGAKLQVKDEHKSFQRGSFIGLRAY